MKLKYRNNQNFKFLLLIILFLIFFYFLIFKNILNYLELKEYISSETIKIQRLSLENEELNKAFILKQKELEDKSKSFENLTQLQDEKQEFSNISEAFNYVDVYMNKNNIFFESYGRSQKNGNFVNVSFTFSASERNTLNFFKDLENSKYYFNLSDYYFKISQKNYLLISKLTLQFKIEDNFEKGPINISQNNNVLFGKTNFTNKNNSFMRIGNNTYHKNNSNKSNLNKEDEKSNGGEQ